MNKMDFLVQRQSIRLIASLIMLMVLNGCASTSKCSIFVEVPDVPPLAKEIKDVNIALVLGSGGFRGGAHIGVLEVLEENNIPIDLIVGSSAGSFIGALYADNPNARFLKEKLINLTSKELLDTSVLSALRATFSPVGFVQGRAIEEYMHRNLEAKTFRDLKIPLVTVSTNARTNQVAVINSGPIVPAVHASSAMPPVFSPVRLYQELFIDGGVIAPVPVEVAKRYNPKSIIAVDISKPPSSSALRNAFELTNRALDISFYELANRQSSQADVVIHPDLTGFGTFEDEYNEEFYLAGRKAALAVVEELLALVK